MLKTYKYQVAILIAAFTFGLIPIFGQALSDQGVSSFKQTFFMEIFAFTILAPLYLLKLKKRMLKKKDLVFFLLFGISLFMVNLMPLSAIALGMPVALVSLLVYSYPVYTLIISRVWFGDKITLRNLLYILIAVIGVGIVMKAGISEGSVTVIGVVLALLGGISLALWACFGRASSLRKYSPFDTLYWSAMGALPFLILAIPIFPRIFPSVEIGVFNFQFTWRTLALSVAMSFSTTVIGHTLFFYGVEEVPPTNASVLALVEPLVVIVLGTLLFGQALGGDTILGGMLILIASVLINSGE